ncbi:MAG: SMC-Scp complex subunit ScpB [Acidobacteria bacterium]|nr:SMC-Scp complex subunit ScpB [Acidobacteriota bacterium]
MITSRSPVRALQVVDAVGEDDVTEERVEAVFEELRRETDAPDRGLRVEPVAGGWRCATPPQLEPYLKAFHGAASRQRLSQAALEVLSIVAFRQPVTLPEINFVRGTNSAGVLKTLLDRKLIRVSGRKQVVGKPFLYRTSKEFLVHFGLEKPEDLPDPEELVPSAEPAD